MREDGWPETRADGPYENHSNVYIGYARLGEYMSLTSAKGGAWIDGEALARIRDLSESPISYYDAVLEVQFGPDKWHAITWQEAFLHNQIADVPDTRRGAKWLASELTDLAILDSDNGIDEVRPYRTLDEYGFTLELDGQLFEVAVTLKGETSTTQYFEGLS